jgi:hypothetical protein
MDNDIRKKRIELLTKTEGEKRRAKGSQPKQKKKESPEIKGSIAMAG